MDTTYISDQADESKNCSTGTIGFLRFELADLSCIVTVFAKTTTSCGCVLFYSLPKSSKFVSLFAFIYLCLCCSSCSCEFAFSRSLYSQQREHKAGTPNALHFVRCRTVCHTLFSITELTPPRGALSPQVVRTCMITEPSPFSNLYFGVMILCSPNIFLYQSVVPEVSSLYSHCQRSVPIYSTLISSNIMSSKHTSKIFIIGGTGAQGIPVIRALVSDKKYTCKVLTRDPSSTRAKTLLSFGNVELVEGTFANETDLRNGYRGCDGAFVNIDGFNSGEKAEIFWAIRAYELAIEEGIKFFVYGNLDYTLKKSGYDSRFRTGHYDGKGRIGEWILFQNQSNTERMGAALFTTGPVCISS